MISRSRLTP